MFKTKEQVQDYLRTGKRLAYRSGASQAVWFCWYNEETNEFLTTSKDIDDETEKISGLYDYPELFYPTSKTPLPNLY